MIEAPETKIHIPDKGKEIWGIQALNAGYWQILWDPRAVTDLHRMNGSFPLARSRDEAIDRIVARVEHDPDFARRYEGWTFLGVDLTRCVEVSRSAA